MEEDKNQEAEAKNTEKEENITTEEVKAEPNGENTETATTDEEKLKKKKIIKIAWLIVASLVLVVGCVFAVMYFTKSGIFYEAPTPEQKSEIDYESQWAEYCLSQGLEYDEETKNCTEPKNPSSDSTETIDFRLVRWDFKRISTPDYLKNVEIGWEVYKVGIDADGAELYEIRMSDGESIVYVVNENGRYQNSYIFGDMTMAPVSELGLEYAYINPTIDKVTAEYNGVVFEDSGADAGRSYLFGQLMDYYENNGAKLTKLANSPYNGFYLAEIDAPKADIDEAKGVVKNAIYIVKLPSERTIQITGQVGSWISANNLELLNGKNEEYFTSLFRGCGTPSGTTLLTTKPSMSELEVVGNVVTGSGKKIKAYTSKSEKILKMLYSEYSLMGGDNKITYDSFKNSFTHIVVEDGLGNWTLYMNGKYYPVGGCAKPVIYLYPEKTSVLNVAVGANVSVSDPKYPTGGWKNVIARPNGQLRYEGKEYDSLFWEGTGHGIYPSKKGEGVVVGQEKAADTIRKQLQAQGMNTKEISDFMTFWEEKIPQTKYVRLTWLGTKDMNVIAPLYVSKKPDTLIRVFLEMEGMNEKVNLTPQKFVAPQRQGFVVTEWGGLVYQSLYSIINPIEGR